MNSNSVTPDLFKDSTANGASRSELLFEIEIPGRLPSWNEILGMQHWSRAKFKTDLQVQFLSSLRAFGGDSSTKTTFARSITSIASATLASYMETVRQKRRSKFLSKKLAAKNRSSSESKSSGSGKPVPF